MTQKHEPFGDLSLGEEETYDALAACYDDMTADVDYPAWADFIEALFAGSPCPVHGEPFHTVLDLACGTGTMSFLLAERGYEVIGVDFSPEMLAVAAEKSLEGEGEAPIFLCQSMEELDLYGTVDACVCLLDSVNHVTELDRLQQALRRVWLFLEAGGLFVFDVHTPEHLQSLDGGLFLDETDDAYCVWRTEYDPEEAICTYGMDVFQREGEAWYRSTEVHEERAYSIETLTEALRQAGFLDIHTYGDRRLDAPQAGEARVFFTARKPEEAIEHMR